jgi:hypothetical protein
MAKMMTTAPMVTFGQAMAMIPTARANSPRHIRDMDGERNMASPFGLWKTDQVSVVATRGTEDKRLDQLGNPTFLSSGTTMLVKRGPRGPLPEPSDFHREQPYLRDLFPPDSKYIGEPDCS